MYDIIGGKPMAQVGVKELKTHTSQILRRVREEGEIIEITCRGEVVAQITPVRRPIDKQEIEAILAERKRLAEQISAHWPKNVTAAQAVSEDRREL